MQERQTTEVADLVNKFTETWLEVKVSALLAITRALEKGSMCTACFA